MDNKEIAEARRALLKREVERCGLSVIAKKAQKPDRQIKDMIEGRKSFGDRIAREIGPLLRPDLARDWLVYPDEPSEGQSKSRRQLTKEEQEDAERLRSLLDFAKREKGLTQENIAHACGYSGQQAVQAYLSGGTALNLDAAYRFSQALSVPLEAISPRLAARAVELFGATQAAQDHPRTMEALLQTLHDDINNADNDVRKAIVGLVKAYQNNPTEGERIARSIRALLGEI